MTDTVLPTSTLRLQLVIDKLLAVFGATPRSRVRRFGKRAKALDGGQVALGASRISARLGAPCRFTYDTTADLFICSDTGRTHAFAHSERYRMFAQGLDKRAKGLISAYHLDQIGLVEGDRIVDVGANTGDLLLALAHYQIPLSITSIEPSPREFVALSRNLLSNGWLIIHEAHQLGLWDSEGETMRFYVKSGAGDSSLVPIEGYDEVIDVGIRRLDGLLPRQRYKLLKLEAEGAEPEVLRGAEGLLDCFDWISADLGFERGVDQESTLPQVSTYLLARGWEMVAISKPRLVVLFRNPKAGGA